MPFLAIWPVLKSGLSTMVDKLSRLNVWQLLLIASLLLVGVQTLRLHAEQRHGAKLEAQITKIDAALQAERDAVRQKNAQLADISAQLRKANDEENRAIHSDAGTLRVSGPGRAICRPVAPAAPGGASNGRSSDAPVAPLPDARGVELIALPFDDTVNWGADHDYWRARALSWDEWYDNLKKNWPTTGAAAK